MSWFDAAGLANIAKTALKEAQRTIDKALDIKEDEINTVPSNTPIDTNSDDFFSTWGITHSGNIKNDANEMKTQQKLPTNSMWGSFTGSFFDNAAQEIGRKSNSFDSLDDSGMEQHFSHSKLVVQQSEESETRLPVNEEAQESNENDGLNVGSLNVKRREKPAQYHTNRLSAVSTESGKNSSESVDILTCSTECTTSPESELLSVGQSVSHSSSAFDLKQTSESLEILGDSLTSPSSVEVLDPDSISSRHESDEFVSPLQSPLEDDKTSPSIEKVSPESVEVIPEDQDESSMAEDTMSYTSVSESTVLDSAGILHLKPSKMLKDTFIRTEFESVAENLPDPITKAPSRSQMHLPLSQIKPLLIDTQPQKQELPNILDKINVIDIPVEDELNKSIGDGSNDDGSQSDKTLIASESIMESSGSSTTTETSTNSSYLKNMLADAMTEKQEENKQQIPQPPRENSPLSSESRSDLVKIGSDHTSGHTSGDELETTTSSDIEIISSPTNGDSSSTQSRQSPAKQQKLKHTEPSVELLSKMSLKKAKGHTRELSEASSISDDSSEVDRLLKRIGEMTDILESRESKLIDMNRRYVELQEVNNDIKKQLDSVLTKQLESIDLSQVTEEYTQRMSALEKKFQQAIREKDSLRKQLEQTKLDAAMKMSKNELESLISEKDEIIKELRTEGEKLSKQQLQHLNIIKKLRAKEKENENTIKHLKENIDSLSAETDRLKRSLTAKEEVERSQIEAVHNLTTKNKKLEKEIEKLQSNYDDIQQKYNTTKKSLDAAKKELIDKTKASTDLIATEQLLENLEYEKKMTESQNEEIANQLDDLRMKLRQSEQEHIKQTQQLRQENAELMHRLEEAEARNEELSQSVLEVSKPLVRQLESLQGTYNMKMATFEKVEQELTLKIGELQGKLNALSNTEKISKEECINMRTKIAELESDLNTTKNQNENLRMKLEQIEAKKEIELNELQTEINNLNKNLKVEIENGVEKDRLITNLEQQLRVEKSVNDMEKKRTTFVQEQSKNEDRNSPPQSNSPTLSLGKVSVSESMGSSFWAQDEPFDVNQTPRYTNMFEMQMLQTNLKQREGEVQQLQWELSRREQERSLLNIEISSLVTKVEDLEMKLHDFEKIKQELSELQQRCDTLCQLYGEKVEENEELKLDLQDVKDMYKSQIDELLRLQKEQN